MPTFAHDGIELAYDVAGPADGPAVVLLHGLSSARSTWHDELAALAAAGFRAHALDHRGHGGSSKADGTYDITHWTADAMAFLEQVVGRPAVLVGHSLGGVVAASVAGQRPDLVRGALLEDPPLFLADHAEFLASPFGMLFPLMRDAYRAARDRGAPLQEYVDALANVPALNGGGSLADVLGPEGTVRHAQAERDFDPEAMEACLVGTGLVGYDPRRPLEVPVHVLRAQPELAAAFRPQDEAPFLEATPDAVVELVPGASHLIHAEQPALVLDRIRTFAAAHAG